MSGSMLNMWSSLVRLTGEGVLTSEHTDRHEVQSSPSSDDNPGEENGLAVASAQGK